MQFGMKIIDLVRETNEDSIENAPLIPVSCEQPVLWYELHDLSLGVTFGLESTKVAASHGSRQFGRF
jgi:hypothetical protein